MKNLKFILALALVLTISSPGLATVALLNKAGNSPSHWSGLSTDAKPVTGDYDSTFYEENTGTPYVYGTSGWVVDARRSQILVRQSDGSAPASGQVPTWDNTLKKFVSSMIVALPAGGNVGELLINTGSGAGSWQVAPTWNQSTTGTAAHGTAWGAYAGIAGPTQARTYTLPDANSTLVATTGAGTVFQPASSLQYVLDADLTPTIPAAGAEMRLWSGVDTDGTTYSGVTADRAINAPAGATPVDGMVWHWWGYDNGSLHNFTFNAAFVAAGVSMPSNIIASNGALHKYVHDSGRYSKAQAKWMVEGITYE